MKAWRQASDGFVSPQKPPLKLWEPQGWKEGAWAARVAPLGNSVDGTRGHEERIWHESDLVMNASLRSKMVRLLLKRKERLSKVCFHSPHDALGRVQPKSVRIGNPPLAFESSNSPCIVLRSLRTKSSECKRRITYSRASMILQVVVESVRITAGHSSSLVVSSEAESESDITNEA